MNYFDGKRILITGATGLVCSHLVMYFLKNTNAKIYALGRSKNKLHKLFGAYPVERIKCLAQDVSEPIDIQETLDYIFHGAGPIDSITIQEKPMDVVLPNIVGLLNCYKLIKTQKVSKCQIIVFSSATVYGSVDESDKRVSENSVFSVESYNMRNAPYSQSKVMQEIIAYSMFKQYAIDVRIVRLSYVYGDTYFRPNTAFYQFIDMIKEGNDIIINNSGLPRRDNIFVDDVVSGLLTVAKKGVPGEVYNISSGGDNDSFAAIDEMAQILAKVGSERYGKNLKVDYKQKSEKRSAGIILDNSKLKHLGWKPKISLEEGIRKILFEDISIR